MLAIGEHQFVTPVVLAPMAGITDQPFRQMVRRFGVGYCVAEMVSSKPQLADSRKSQQRRISLNEPLPRASQIVGNNPRDMANAAAHNESLGAGIIDINMGCPAKKVCRKAAGSALLADEKQVQAILEAVVSAVNVPVTLKFRTGISPAQNNAVKIAGIAQDCGVQSLAIHGRSRECLFKGQAEYQTIAQVKLAVSIPVIANGDIQTPQQALEVIKQTGADAVMIGRAAQGNPWLPNMIGQAINGAALHQIAAPSLFVQQQSCLQHIGLIHQFYGDTMGVKIARKHIRWYLAGFESGLSFSKKINRSDNPSLTLQWLNDFYEQQMERKASMQPPIAVAA